MSNSIDSKIVEMKIDNTQLKSGATESLSIMDKLKASLSFSGATKGLSEVSRAASGLPLGTIENGVLRINKGFAAMATIAVTSLTRITNSAITAGTNLVKSLTVAPVKQGLQEYETTLNSVQTILANTGLKGQQGLDKVNGALKELNDYSDLTIYNFSEMARNIGTFTAAGVKLEPATQAIKGIANLAAVSGSNSQQASTAMYQLSQALASGTVKLMDWNSVVNAGMGGKVFQEALKETAKAHGVAVDSIIKKEGSFRDSLSTGWLTTDILTSTLKQFAGDVTAAQLAAEGFSKSQIKQILEMGKTATDAATKVKTMSQLIGTLQETAGSGWAQTWQLIFGDFGEAKQLFTGLNDTLGGIIGANADARNKILADWKELGGRTVAIEAIKNVWNGLLSVIRPIREAFRDIFPAMTGQRLYELTVAFRDFTEGLKLSGPSAEALKQTFKGVFALLDIGVRIIKAVVGNFFDMAGVFSEGSGSILDLTAGIAGLIIALRDWLVEGDKLANFFDGLQESKAKVFAPIIALISSVIGALATLTTSGVGAFIDELGASFDYVVPIIEAIVDNVQSLIDTLTGGVGLIDLSAIFGGLGGAGGGAKAGIDGVTSSMERAANAAKKVDDVFAAVGQGFVAVKDFVVAAAQAIGRGVGFIKEKFSALKEGIGLDDTLAVINTGFLTALYFSIRKFVKQVGGTFEEMKNTFRSASGVLDQVTSNLKSMQTEVRARAILMIAAALVLLAGALFVLSKIDTKDLAQSLAAVAALLALLVGAIMTLEKKVGGMLGTSSKLVVLAAAMVLMASAIAILAGVVALLGQLDIKTLSQGIGAVASILGVIVAATAILSKTGGAAQMVLAAAAIGIMASSLIILAGALKLFASISVDTLVNGGLKIAAVLIGLGIALRAIPKKMVGSAVALFIVANALVVMAGALKLFGMMSVGEIAKSLITLGVSLGIIAAALNLMKGTVKASLAMVIFAGALALLVPSIVALGSLPLDVLVQGIGALAAIFVVLGAAAAILAPLAPVIVALAGGIALLGLAVALVGGGMFLFATGMAALAAGGLAGVAVLTASVIAIAELLPLIAHQFGLALRALAVVIAKSGPELVAAFGTVLASLIKAITQNIPGFMRMLTVFVLRGLEAIRRVFPDVVRTGFELIMTLLRGIEKNIGDIVTTVGKIVTKFINALGKELPRIVDAGAKFIVKFIRSLADAVEENTDPLIDAAFDLGEALITGMLKGLAEGPERIAKAAWGLGKSAIGAIAGAIDSGSPSKEAIKLGKWVGAGFAIGLIGGQDQVDQTLNDMKTRIKAFFDNTKSDLATAKSDLEQLQQAKGKDRDSKAIEKAKKQIETLEMLHDKAAKARKVLKEDLKDEQKELRALSRLYDKTTEKLEEATKALDDAKKARDDFAKSTTDKYSALPEIGSDESFSSFADRTRSAEAEIIKFKKTLDNLRKRGLTDVAYNQLLEEGTGAQGFLDKVLEDGKKGVAQLNQLADEFAVTKHSALDSYFATIEKEAGDVERFKASLDALKLLGLDDATYRKLVEDGPSVQPFVDQLLASGQGGVNQLNALNARLSGAATALGNEAARVLYQSGVDSAQKTVDGLIDGFNNPESIKALEKAMGRLARTMVRKLKKELKIKSPSRVFEEIAKYSNQGLAGGLEKYSNIVNKSAAEMADQVVSTVKLTMRDGLADPNLLGVDMNPVIAPVLDLSQVKKDSAALEAMLNTSASYAQASSISAERQAALEASTSTDGPPPTNGPTVEFKQYNTSPKALSESEIYRNTKNGLSLLEKELSGT